MEKKEDTYRRVLIDVIRFLDEGYQHSEEGDGFPRD